MIDVQISKFKVTGMHCSSCSTAVQKALSVTPGVERASVSLTLEQAEVVYDPGLAKEVSRHLAWLSTSVRWQLCVKLHQLIQHYGNVGHPQCMLASNMLVCML